MIISNLPSLLSNLFDTILPYIPGATRMVYSQLQGTEIAEPVGIRSMIVTTLFIVASILGARLWLGMLRSYIMMIHGTKPQVKDLAYAPWIYVARLIGASILVALATLVGLIALIIPGIYIAVRLSMVQYLIVEGYGVMDAIKTSRAMTKGNVWKLIGAGFVFMGVIILWVLALVVWLLWAIPTVNIAQTYIYLQLKKNIPVLPTKEHI